jgi:hypothetical protein
MVGLKIKMIFVTNVKFFVALLRMLHPVVEEIGLMQVGEK